MFNLFSAWGEGVFVVIQTAIVAALVLLYGTKPGKGKRTCYNQLTININLLPLEIIHLCLTD